MSNTIILFLYGVHGSGKTLLGEIFAEDEGFKYIRADAIEYNSDVVNLSPLERQLFFKGIASAQYAIAFGYASKGKNVVVDFGPYQIIPYTYWWVPDKASIIEKMIKEEFNALLNLYKDVTIAHIFLLVPSKDKYDVIVSRILKRKRKNVQEEADFNYVSFIDSKLREIMDDLQKDGEHVYEIDASMRYIDKYKELMRIINSLQ